MKTLTLQYLQAAAEAMRSGGIELDPGLTPDQIQAAESVHGFRFPPDLRVFLEYALPVGERFPDWRQPDSPFILDRLSWPADSMCFDISNNAFWLPSWGAKPGTAEQAHAIARGAVSKAPFLVPIFAHRYLPAMPCKAGNPIFSVYQTDIIYYGFDLPSYFFAEFQVPNPFPALDHPRNIEFWSEVERLNG